jgi:non-ribosomal peptide synthetase component F/acyl carrier protein
MTIETGQELPAGAHGSVAAPLSFAQEQLWFLDQLTPDETTYNILMVWRLRGPLRVDLLQRCLNLVVARHDALRVTIHDDAGRPYQTVAAPAEVPLPVIDLRALSEAEREQRVRAELDARLAEPYDLEAGPLCRFRLLWLDDKEYVFCQGFHHVITDGWSTGLVNADLSTAYRSLYAGVEPVFEDVELGYAEFAEAQRERLQGEVLAEELEFWQQLLAGLPTLELPVDRPRPSGGSHRGGAVVKDFPPDLRGIVERLAEDQGSSLFMVLTAAFDLVFSRYTGLEDIPLGVPMLGRPEPELEGVVGMFINMVVLRSDLSGDPTFGELIDRVMDGTLDLYEHQEVSFNQVVDAVQPVRDPDRNPLFQVSLQLLGGDTSGENLAFPGVVTESVPQSSLNSRFDIAVNILDTGSSLIAGIEYSSDMFDGWRMEAMLDHVETVLRTAAADPELRLSQIPIVPGDEAERLISAGRGDVVECGGQVLDAALAQKALERPDAVAVVCGGVELSYGELDRRADALARYLRAKGLRRGDVVAAVIDRDLDAYVAMLGVLKAGGAYAVLDPRTAPDQLAFMIDDTAAPLVLTRSGLADLLPESADRQTVLLDTAWPAVEAIEADGPLEQWATPDMPAYVVYGPGPDDRPAGVVITHQAAVSCCEAYRRAVDLGPDDRLLQLSPLSGALAQNELWTGLLTGATVVAATSEEGAAPERVAELIRSGRITCAGLPLDAAALIDADASAYPDLTTVVRSVQGPTPGAPGAESGAPRRVVLYGPAEAPVACTGDGRPQANRQLYVVDRSMNMVPRGVVGELLIGGEPGALAAGYLHRPEPTAERFIEDPFRPGRLVYRTGQQVRWTTDLAIEFVGPAGDAAIPSDAAPIDGDARTDPAEAGADEPRTPTEQSVAEIIGEVLSVEKVGAEDGFFSLGGSSLQAMRVISRINKRFGVKLAVRTLYGEVTLRAVSAALDEKLREKTA